METPTHPHFDEESANKIYHGKNNLLKMYEINIYSAVFIISEQYEIKNGEKILNGDNTYTYKIKNKGRTLIMKLKTGNKENENILNELVDFLLQYNYNYDIHDLLENTKVKIQEVNDMTSFMTYLVHRYIS